MSNKISIIGAGNLGLSLAKGLVESGDYQSNQFHLSRRRIEKLNSMADNGYQIFNNNINAIQNTSIIILAVLPQKINDILDELKAHISDNQLVVSLVSGVEINQISEKIVPECVLRIG